MTDTKKRIKAYKEALPGIKERITAVALLLAMSMAMMTSATFAWLTISRRPEVTGVNTTVAANGNLEIALVSPDGSEPAESAVGDSSAAIGQSVTAANLTWGNLVNLSDESYGLSNIVLRPALLGNTNNLLKQPLKGVDYGKDGRVELYYNEDFQFVNWVAPNNGLDGYFKYNNTPQYGVRALSTVEYTYVNNTYYQFTELMKVATAYQDQTKALYEEMIDYDPLVDERNYIETLAGLIGDFMTDKLNDKNGTTDVSKYMEDVYYMLVEFDGVVESFKDAIVALANVQVYNKYGPDDYSPYTYTKETFFYASDLATNGVEITCLDDYLKVEKELASILYGEDPDTNDCFADYYAVVQGGGKVYFSDITSLINRMVNINKCQIILKDGTTYNVGDIGMTAATQILGQDIDAKITSGVLKDFEKVSGCKMLATDVDVKAKFIITVTMTADTITTNATEPYLYDIDVTATEEVAASNKGEYTGIAQDTYGMAMDLWVRTNAVGSYLVLEGNVLTETNTVRSTGVDMNGEPVELYTVTITTMVTNDEGEDEELSDAVAVYKMTAEDGTVTWRNATNHSLIYNEDGSAPEGQTISEPIERYEDVVTVIGYEGENRVWQDNLFMDTDSTTQGSGSCYVFYAEDPAQQESSLQLLSNLRVAFVDNNEDSATYGKMVASAQLDIENRYEESGKVTVPLKLVDDGSSYLTKTEEGLAILPLEQNTATRLMAFVYLDGREISNADVLAANDIQGQLNIQFGSSVELNPISNELLEQATRSVSVVSKKSADAEFGAANALISFDYEKETNPMSVDIRLTVTGDEPTNVYAFFMRKVNETQGSREQSFKLTEDPDNPGVWTGTFTFTSPGEYVMRTVQLDGVDYNLSAQDYPQVKIEGFAITSVDLSYNNVLVTEKTKTIMTGEKSISTELSLQFATDQTKLPSSVKLQFMSDDGDQVTANMHYNATTTKWTGNAIFGSSGEYTLQYVIMDGEYTQLSTEFQKVLALTMGITVRVNDGGNLELRNTTFLGEAYTIPMYVEIFDDTGAELRYLSGVRLYYSRSGSNVEGMSPDVTWNAEEGCYTGNLRISGPGVYDFSSIQIGGNNLKSTLNVPPTFTCISPEPPVYKDAQPMDGMDYLLATGNDGYAVGVRLAHAAGATVTAVLTDADTGETHEVTTVAGSTVTENNVPISTFSFVLPYTNDGANQYQIGDWTITQLKLANVYDADSNFYGESNPMVMTLPADEDRSVKVVTVKVSVDGKDETLDGGQFMGTAASQQAIKVIIADQNGDALDSNYIDFAEIKMRYQYKMDSSQEHGGYTSAAEDELTPIEITPASDDGKTFTMSKMTFAYAGQYECHSLTLDVIDVASKETVKSMEFTSEEYASSRPGITILDMPVYILKTTTPTVKVTGTTTGTINVHTGTRGSDGSVAYNETVSGDFNKKTDYSAVVFLAASGRNVNVPEVKLTLSGMPSSGFTASLIVPNASDSQYNRTYQFTANNQEQSQNIGGGVNGSNGVLGFGATDPKIFPAGKQTVDEISIVYNGITFAVDLSSAVTISQPQIPLYVDFTIGNSAYTGSVPGRVYSLDGETIQLTLPTANDVTISWNEAKTDTTTGAFTTVSTTNTDYYETWDDGCDGAMYQKYTKTVAVSEAEETITSYTRKWTITGWKVGNTTYALGETITITGSQTISAVLTSTDSGHTVTKNLITRTTKYYAPGSDTPGTPPTGYVDVSNDPDNGNKDRWTSSNPNVVDVRTPKN